MDLNSQKPSWLPKFLVLLAVITAGGVGAYLQKQSASSDSEPSPDLAVTGIKSSDGEAVTAVVTPSAETKTDDLTVTDESKTISSATASTSTSTTSPKTSTTTTSSATTETSTPAPTAGVYSAIGDYTAPSGPESIDVTLTVVGGMIVEANVDSNTQNPISKKFQMQFIAAYRSFVVGKKIADLELTTVAGSSLTPKGFNDALADIRTQING